MQRLILATFLVCIVGHPAIHSQRIDSSSTTIPNAFGSGSVSKMANLQAIKTPQSICIDNRTAVEIAVNCSTAENVVPTDTTQNLYANANQTACIDSALIKGDCYIRSMGAAITTGVVVVTVNARE